MRLRVEDADDRDVQRPLEVGQAGCGRRVAGDDHELDALLLEMAPHLEREAAHLCKRAGAVRQPGVVAEVHRILVRQRDEQLVEDGEAAHARVEDADGRASIARMIRGRSPTDG